MPNENRYSCIYGQAQPRHLCFAAYLSSDISVTNEKKKRRERKESTRATRLTVPNNFCSALKKKKKKTNACRSATGLCATPIRSTDTTTRTNEATTYASRRRLTESVPANWASDEPRCSAVFQQRARAKWLSRQRCCCPLRSPARQRRTTVAPLGHAGKWRPFARSRSTGTAPSWERTS